MARGSADRIIEATILWFLRFLQRRFRGNLSPNDIDNASTQAASRRALTSRIYRDFE
jgi:hypothetical protein